MLGLSQTHLAKVAGVTHQQLHKYEKGINRLSVGRLFALAQVLDVKITYFFEELHGTSVKPNVQDRLMLELAKNFAAITSRQHREALVALSRAMAGFDRADGDGL